MTEESKDQGKTLVNIKLRLRQLYKQLQFQKQAMNLNLQSNSLLGQDETNWFPNVLSGARMAKVPLMAIYILESV